VGEILTSTNYCVQLQILAEQIDGSSFDMSDMENDMNLQQSLLKGKETQREEWEGKRKVCIGIRKGMIIASSPSTRFAGVQRHPCRGASGFILPG